MVTLIISSAHLKVPQNHFSYFLENCVHSYFNVPGLRLVNFCENTKEKLKKKKMKCLNSLQMGGDSN